MLYVNRLFFDKNNGACLYRYSMEGDIIIHTVEEDIAFYIPDVAFDDVATKEISQDDIETINNLNTCYKVNLDLETNELEFDFNFPPVTETT